MNLRGFGGEGGERLVRSLPRSVLGGGKVRHRIQVAIHRGRLHPKLFLDYSLRSWAVRYGIEGVHFDLEPSVLERRH